MLTGVVVGYDPGGNGAHGIAELHIRDGKPTTLEMKTMQATEDVIRFMEDLPSIVALGVDTLTCWCTGSGAWRPADRWLRDHYKEVRNSIVTPNGLFGSMGLNGMAVLVAARQKFPDLLITETHPKVLYWQLSKKKYDYLGCKVAMDQTLANALHLAAAPATEHEWDAAISALAAFEGASGRWHHDLHSLPHETAERIVSPCGRTKYFWPV